MQVRKIAVVGAGTMGSSISMALINSGYDVLLKDTTSELVEAGIKRIDKMLESAKKKGLSEQEAQARKVRLSPVVDYKRFGEVELVIEAVLEKIEIKKAVFADLEKHCRPEAILATNTSSLPITQIAGYTSRPERVIGLHFFNPAHLMKLVEVIPGLQTDEKTIETAMQFAASLGKLAVRVEECASFLVNRLLGRYMNESLWCLLEGSAAIEEIDSAACQVNAPIGPLALRDMNGADIGMAVANFNFQEYGDRYLPCPLLSQMVEANMLGQKTGKGFYIYDPETKKKTGPNQDIEALAARLREKGGAKAPFEGNRLFLPMINEAFLVLQERVCRMEDLDPAIKAGLGMRKGPLELAAEIGLKHCLSETEKLFELYGERFRPAPLLKRYVWAGKTSIT